ncbi:hypothetical protein BCR43DRAFT_496017 [Syncephalastrum racemosum]|uniref:Uncharacterized protein n=1 Tax=Syncephalastrum racemosum TaxID=13706 RepID=A0A1X2H6T1_SYNRA|nr:hypothetical protein BCR43DRAFT_496017 [Syncephalastrum racemosum]
MTIPADQQRQQVPATSPQTRQYHSQKLREEHVKTNRKKEEQPPPPTLGIADYTPKPHRGTLFIHHHKPIEDEEEEEEDYTGFSDEKQSTVCSCGRPLGKGWQCFACRRACPYCARALSNEPDEFCDRCFSVCSSHGPFPIVCNPHMACPGCQ